MARADPSGSTQVKLQGLDQLCHWHCLGEGWINPICHLRWQGLKKNSKLGDAQLHAGRDITFSISQGAAISSNFPLSPGTHTEACYSWLFLQHHPIHEGRFDIHYLSGRLGQSSGMTEGWKRNPDLCRMSLPHPSNLGKGINLCTTPIHGIVDARFLFHFYLFP